MDAPFATWAPCVLGGIVPCGGSSPRVNMRLVDVVGQIVAYVRGSAQPYVSPCPYAPTLPAYASLPLAPPGEVGHEKESRGALKT